MNNQMFVGVWAPQTKDRIGGRDAYVPLHPFQPMPVYVDEVSRRKKDGTGHQSCQR